MGNKNEPVFLADYLQEKKLKVVNRQPASYVPPKYMHLPEDQKVMTGLANVEELTLTDGRRTESTIWTCVDDDRVFENVYSAAAHRSSHTRIKTMQENKAEEARRKAREKMFEIDDETKAIFEKLGLEPPAYKQLAQKFIDAQDGYDALYADFTKLKDNQKTLLARIEELDKILKQYEEEAFPNHLRLKFISMLADSLEVIGDKWLDVVSLNRETANKSREIIES